MNDTIVPRRMSQLGAALDHRVVDAIHGGRLFNDLKALQHPEVSEQKPQWLSAKKIPWPDYAAILKEIAKWGANLLRKAKLPITSRNWRVSLVKVWHGLVHCGRPNVYRWRCRLKRFSIQSISKVFTLGMTIRLVGKALFSRGQGTFRQSV
ncbi:MAG: hypothetical protein IPL65_19200 [Lewinellaceae bacterium]|nr:hypothetical protein [Lewinellaceae bacterium]